MFFLPSPHTHIQNGCIQFDENGDIDIGAALSCLTDSCSDYLTSPMQFGLCAAAALTADDPLPVILGCLTNFGVFLPGVS